jgi:hypothetical protein
MVRPHPSHSLLVLPLFCESCLPMVACVPQDTIVATH